MICIESAIEERFPGLNKRKPLLGKGLLKVLRFICHEKEFKLFEKTYPHLEGFDFLEQALRYFDFSYRVKDTHREKIPNQGRVVIVANHPIGSLDGLALLKMVGEIRRDVRVVANELLYAIKPLRSLLLPVDNMAQQSGKQQLKAIRGHLENEGAIIIFPAGEVSRMGPSGIKDSRWNSGFLRFASKTQSPILPMFVDGRNSWFFYSLSLFAKPISTLWLIREMFKHAKSHVDISVGDAVTFEQYQNLGVTPAVVSKLFRKHVYRLANSGKKKHDKKRTFASEYEAIAHPENRQLLRKEMQGCQQLGQTSDGKSICLYRYTTNSVIIRELGRLRELSFRFVKEGTGKRRDVDPYDRFYDHIVLWDDKELEIVGAYRMVQSNNVNDRTDLQPALYTQTLFANKFSVDAENEDLRSIYKQGLELGRSFIQPQYWGKRSLDYLWQGIGAYLKANPHIRYLFGPVSISYEYSSEAKDLLIRFYQNEYGVKNTLLANAAEAITPYEFLDSNSLMAELDNMESVAAKFQALKSTLKKLNHTVPTLYKQYTELCQPGGCQFLAFNVDKDFADCVDGLVLVDLEKVKPEKRKRYLEAFVTAE